MHRFRRLIAVAAEQSWAKCKGATPALGAALAVTAGTAGAGPIDIPGWDLVWQDEFDQAGPDTSEWELFDLRNSFNNELQYYRPEQITTNNGNLVITATDQPLSGKQYRSGRMESWQEFGFGRFEARIQLPSGQGYWPAFWLLPETDTTPWPTGGEIDILENRGSQPNLVSSAYHYNNTPGTSNFQYDEYTISGPDNFHNSFHDFAVEWEADAMRFYVDGVNYHTLTGDQVPIYDTPKKIVLNLAVGGFFGGNPDATTPFPAEMLVDYVRVWERSDDVPTDVNLLSNPSFEDAGGSLSAWDTFGNSIPNVVPDNGQSLDGSTALKIFGQFNGGENFSGAQQGVAVTEGTALRAEASALTPFNDTLAGKNNQVIMKLEFYSVFGAAFDSGNLISEVTQVILDGSTAEDVWLDHALEATAPAGAVEARVAFVFRQPSNENGAVWIDDVGLFALIDALVGDYNGDGFVSQGDLDLVLLNWGDGTLPAGFETDALPGGGPFDGLVSQNELDGVLLNWGSGTPPSATAIPEPATAITVLAGVAWAGQRRRR